ncbi:hypothetical protein [Streptomyces tsukubensis]|uniref:Serine/threonine protein kinase n=1 Tax=Streptomyces tsukubensis TaxID=83656 RepID=A0A1V4A169_9ACTN|nr:hypothetical protein [Streptomyces tsukubensis]OON72945.1 hypothetical protein B1H18_28490 [Streptomyces tsukubensis]QFR94454.1 hypothetical protein GBW32_17135 [Streptomyces tsukubensis]
MRTLRTLAAVTSAVATTVALTLTATVTATASPPPAPAPAPAPVAGSVQDGKIKVPGFLAPTDLPPHASSKWRAWPVTAGVPGPEPYCLDKGAIPAGAGTYHRFFRTEYDTEAGQTAVVTKSAEAAKKLAGSLGARVLACADGWLDTAPGGSSAGWRDYGTVAGGAHVYGVDSSVPDSEPSVHLFAIGRDGATVTAVNWGEMGSLKRVPIAAFKKTATTAVEKLYP